MNSNDGIVSKSISIALVSAGTSEASTTGMLANRIGDSVVSLAQRNGTKVNLEPVDLKSLSQDIMTALVSQHMSPKLSAVSETLRNADALIVATPVYKAGPSGLFTAFFQVLDNDLLIGTPVVLAGTAGSARHALVVDDQLRGLFSYLRTIAAPTSVFAEPNDWTSGELGKRIDRSTFELLALVESGFREKVRTESWGDYQHSFGSAGGTEFDVDFDSELMRLATGGR